MKLTFTVPAKPVAKARPRFTLTGHAYTPKTTRDFERLVAACARCAMASTGEGRATGALRVWLEFYYTPPKSWTKAKQAEVLAAGALPKTTKPDVDNLAKAVLDAMNGVVFEDDNQISGICAVKAWSYKRGDTVSVMVVDDKGSDCAA